MDRKSDSSTQQMAYEVLEANLKKTLRQLRNTNGSRVARRNARRAADRFLRDAKHIIEFQWPRYSKNGTAVKPRKQKGVVCPLCKAVLRSYSFFATHLIRNHRCVDSVGHVRCPCGKTFQSAYYKSQLPTLSRKQKITAPKKHEVRIMNASTRFIRHLQNIKDLEAHMVLGRLGDDK